MSKSSATARNLLISTTRSFHTRHPRSLSASCAHRQFNTCSGSKHQQSLHTRAISHIASIRPRHLQSSTIFNRFRRRFSTSPIVQHGHIETPKPGEERKVTFIDKDNSEHTFSVNDGDNLLDIAQHFDIEMEGACGGSCACSTCHVIVESDADYDKMPEPDDDENDMLDLAFGLTETSRLGCQVKMTKELDGLRVKLPQMTRNLQASDFEDKKR